MTATYLHNVIIPGTKSVSGILYNQKEILAVGPNLEHKVDALIDGEGAFVLPGLIDAHVHFREPGLTHKADISSESLAALRGGVTSYFDMPNTLPTTTTPEAWAEKMRIASASSHVNYAFFVGLTDNNSDVISGMDFSRIPGVKVFMGSSTGNMMVESDNVIGDILSKVKVPVVIHAEDENVIARERGRISALYQGNPPVAAHTDIRSVEACVKATKRAIELLRQHPGAHLHIAHVSTGNEIELIAKAKSEGLKLTCEVSPHHLLFSSDDYERLGSRIKMNPSIKSVSHREALRQAVRDGIVDIIATDHAPHTLEEKQGNALTAVSGAPMVQFSLAVIADLFGLQTVMRTMAKKPAEIFGLPGRGMIAPGYAPEFVLVKKIEQGYVVSDTDVVSKCGWTPLDGFKLHHKVVRTIIPKAGPLRFEH